MFAYILLSICENHGTQVRDVYLDADKANDDYAALIAGNNTSYMRYQLITRTVKEKPIQLTAVADEVSIEGEVRKKLLEGPGAAPVTK